MDEIKEQQTVANEILFLRYLQLDSLEALESGRTPLTITKRLINPGKSEFGFSVIWTHPPRIDEVEEGSPAGSAGILPGDYIIFIDKNNIVDMQEEEIINLIRYYGGLLTLEIFRRSASAHSALPKIGNGKKISLTRSAVSLGSTPTAAAPSTSTVSTFSNDNSNAQTENILNSKVLHQIAGFQNVSISPTLQANFLKTNHHSGRMNNNYSIKTEKIKEQQKLADEFSFLRHIKLDRKENVAENLQTGRTPLTSTKLLINPGKSEFGFSIIWTHPPRIDKVEEGSPAKTAGILAGDYIIFVDENNVVDMKEEEIMNLFRYCGCLVLLEIFRVDSSKNSFVESNDSGKATELHATKPIQPRIILNSTLQIRM